jgi:hypothetical protein
MQLQELEYHWKRLDEKVDQALAIETELLRRVVLEPVHRRVNRMAFWPAVDVAFCIGAILLVVTSIGNHWLDSRVLAPAGAVIFCFLALLIDSILQLSRISELDWSGPVSEIQSSLAELRVAKVRQFKWIMLLSPLWQFCGLIVAVEWLSLRLTGDPLTIIKKFEPRWILGNLLFGVVFAILGFLIIYAFSQAFKSRPWWQSMLDGISGKSLSVARKDVELWAGLRAEKVDNGK